MVPPTSLVRGLREQIADRLRDEVLAGRIAAGTALREIELSQRFEVSRGPVREALQQLTHEGLLVAEPNRGVRVRSAAPDSIRQLIVPVRRTIETFALRSFFDQIDDDDFATWEEILQRMKNACRRADYPAITEQDLALHRSFLIRAGQEDLLAIWSVIVARVRLHFRQGHARYPRPMDIYNEHGELIDTFRGDDVEAAVKALEENIA
jgi:DNA-binding GntR family transcriptional regulator